MTMKKVTPEKPSKAESIDREIWWPSFTLKMKDIPEAKKWNVGNTYRLEIQVELKGIRESERKSTVEFDIKAVGVIKKNPKEEYKKMVIGGK